MMQWCLSRYIQSSFHTNVRFTKTSSELTKARRETTASPCLEMDRGGASLAEACDTVIYGEPATVRVYAWGTQ